MIEMVQVTFHLAELTCLQSSFENGHTADGECIFHIGCIEDSENCPSGSVDGLCQEVFVEEIFHRIRDMSIHPIRDASAGLYSRYICCKSHCV